MGIFPFEHGIVLQFYVQKEMSLFYMTYNNIHKNCKKLPSKINK